MGRVRENTSAEAWQVADARRYRGPPVEAPPDPDPDAPDPDAPVAPPLDVPEAPPFGSAGDVAGGVTDSGWAGEVDVPGVVVVPGAVDVPGAGAGDVPVVPVAPGVVDSGCPAPFTGGVVAAPGPVPGAHGAITSAFGAPFEPSVPAVPVVPGTPVAGIALVAPFAPVAAPVVPVAPLVAGVFRLPVADPFVAFGGTTPLVPVAPVSGTHGIVAGGVAAPGDTPVGEVVCGVDDGVCAFAAALESPSAAAAA